MGLNGLASHDPFQRCSLEQSWFWTGDQKEELSTTNGFTPSEPDSESVETRNSFLRKSFISLPKNIQFRKKGPKHRRVLSKYFITSAQPLYSKWRRIQLIPASPGRHNCLAYDAFPSLPVSACSTCWQSLSVFKQSSGLRKKKLSPDKDYFRGQMDISFRYSLINIFPIV